MEEKVVEKRQQKRVGMRRIIINWSCCVRK